MHTMKQYASFLKLKKQLWEFFFLDIFMLKGK